MRFSLLAGGILAAAALLPACSSCGTESLTAADAKVFADADEQIVLDAGGTSIDAGTRDEGVVEDANVVDATEEQDAAGDDAGVGEDAANADAGVLDIGIADTGADPCPVRAIFMETFETYAAGDALGSVWTSTVVGTGEVRINFDAEGEGAGPSARFMIMLENGGTSNVWVGTPEIDLRACTNRIVTIDARLVPFSLMGASDRLRIEAADDGMNFTDLGTLFPGTAFTDNTCAPGSQNGSAGPGCVPWGSFSYSIPPAAFTARFRVALRLIGDGDGAVGIDDFSINVR